MNRPRGRAVKQPQRYRRQRGPQAGPWFSNETTPAGSQSTVDLCQCASGIAQHHEQARGDRRVDRFVGEGQPHGIAELESAVGDADLARMVTRASQLAQRKVNADCSQARMSLGKPSGVGARSATDIDQKRALIRPPTSPQTRIDAVRVVSKAVLPHEGIEPVGPVEEACPGAVRVGASTFQLDIGCHDPQATTVAVTTWRPVAPCGAVPRSSDVWRFPSPSIARTAIS